MKAVVFERFGQPAEVLQVKEVPIPKPTRGQVRVRMLASPLNPSDLLYIQGRYGRRPELPASPGFEGAGVVEESGGGLIGRLRLGRRVAVLNGTGGNWQEHVVVPARQVVPVPSDIPDEQAATFFVNPASALIMTRKVLCLPRGAWLLQTAAGSSLGRMVIRLAQLPENGFRTLNVVRRREQVAELEKLGADAVVCTADESLEERVAEITQGKGVQYAIDAVGGATGGAALRCLGRGGRMLVYGTLSDEPMEVDPRTLMVGQKRLEGFWLSEWIRDQNPISMLRLFRKIGKLMERGALTTESVTSFPLDQVRAAVELAGKPGRGAKVLLRFGG